MSGKCEECSKKKQTVQRASLSPRGRETEGEGKVPPIVHEVLRSPGQPLDSATRTFMESRFGHDFSQVRVHTDPARATVAQLPMSQPGDRFEQEADRLANEVTRAPGLGVTRKGQGATYDFSRVRLHISAQAEESARALDASAYTVGRDVVFGASAYRPNTPAGRELLAHELAHVVQQSTNGFSPLLQRREEPGAPVAPTGARPAPTGARGPAVGRPVPESRDRRDIYVIDFGVNRDVVNWREAILHIGEIEAQSVDQMVRDVSAGVGDPTRNCLNTLTLDGHGSPGNMSVGDGTGWVAGGNISVGNFRPSLNNLTPVFCSGATVILLGCNVGRGPTGARFIQSLADLWHVNVGAATGFVRGYGIEGVWVWGLPGQVLPGDAMLIVDQIVRILAETTYGDDEEMIFEILGAADASHLLADVRAELVRLGRWNELRGDLRDEDEDRLNRLYPGEPR